MNVNEILDTIDDMLDKAWGLPLSGGKCVVDVERLRSGRNCTASGRARKGNR